MSHKSHADCGYCNERPDGADLRKGEMIMTRIEILEVVDQEGSSFIRYRGLDHSGGVLGMKDSLGLLETGKFIAMSLLPGIEVKPLPELEEDE